MCSDKTRDSLFAGAQDMIVDFVFDEKVAQVFADMIRRSVPGYDAVITLLGLFARQYAQPNSNLYDLGCSTGAATLALRRRCTHPGARIIAVDNSAAMIERCRIAIEHDTSAVPVELVCADIEAIELQNASMVVLNFTLQFLPPDHRQTFLDRVWQSLLPGGVLVLSEKIIFNAAKEHDFQEAMQLAFKKANGYSELEISQKRTALENVLIPDTLEQHQQRLAAAGFQACYVWFRAFNFISLVAFK